MPLFPSVRERFAEGQPPLRVPELARLVGCSSSYVYKLIKAQVIEAGRVGTDYRIPVSEAVKVARAAGLLQE